MLRRFRGIFSSLEGLGFSDDIEQILQTPRQYRALLVRLMRHSVHFIWGTAGEGTNIHMKTRSFPPTTSE